jgi:hypothetical protein
MAESAAAAAAATAVRGGEGRARGGKAQLLRSPLFSLGARLFASPDASISRASDD